MDERYTLVYDEILLALPGRSTPFYGVQSHVLHSFAKGPTWTLRGFKVSRMLNVNTLPFKRIPNVKSISSFQEEKPSVGCMF